MINKEIFEKPFDSRIQAKISLSIDAITLNAENPYLWASGFRMPIYNDNRRLLRYYLARMYVAKGFKEKIKEKNIDFDIIAGTSTSGIAPAVSLAESMNLPLSIIYNDKIYIFTQEKIRELKESIYANKDYDVVASTCPFGIIPGIALANEKQLPFIYIRQKKKEHGLQQKIEGILEESKKVLVIDYFMNESYVDNVIPAIEEKKGKIIGTISKEMDLMPSGVMRKKIMQIEDLISTGGSSKKEIEIYRENGAEANYLMSIFNYGFPEVQKEITEDGTELDSLLYYPTLLDVALEEKKVKPEQQNMLEGWYKDAFNWGEKHGFPKGEVKK